MIRQDFEDDILQYLVTSNPLQAEKIISKYDAIDIINKCDVIGIVYHLIKKEPILIRSIKSRERLNDILQLLKEEYRTNIELLDTVKSMMSVIDLLEQPNFVPEFKEFLDITIKYFNSQTYEITATIVAESDIREMTSYLIEPLKYLTISSCYDYLNDIINSNNCFYIMMEMNIINDRMTENVFSDVLDMISHILDLVSKFEDTYDDFNFDDGADLLETLTYSKQELYDLCIQNIPINLYELDKLDFMKMLSSMRLLNRNESNMKIIEVTVIKYLEDIDNELTSLSNRNVEPDDIIHDIGIIVELDYRLPRVLYLISNTFEIVDYLEDPYLFTEYKVLKDLEFIEQEYRDFCYDKDVEYSKHLNINWNKLNALVPVNWNEYDRDNIISSD